jgi:hypothetical protein
MDNKQGGLLELVRTEKLDYCAINENPIALTNKLNVVK